MKARGCALSGRLVLELVRSSALLLALTAAAGLAQADDGATAVAEPPPAAEAKPATEPAPAAEAPPAAAKPVDAKPAEEKPVEAKTTEKPSDAEATRAEKRKEAEAKAKAEAAKLQVQLITLGGTYEDIVGANEFDPTSLVIGGSPGKRKNFYKLCELLEETAKNPKIHAVVIDLSDADLGMNLAQLDELAPFGTMKATLNRWVGGETSWVEAAAKPKKEMSFFELMGKVMSGGPEKATKVSETSIAVMHLSGAIVDGKKESPGSIVSGPTVKAIQEIGRDDKIKGVVVRINSPGGSATASEAIRQALAELAKKKATVVSMGDVAASGGYWVACLGVPVYAERGTLTGSIGVFSMKISYGSLLKRVGLHMENIALDEAASAFAPDRGWNEDDQAKLQKTIDDVYGRFLKLVSDSRGIPVEKLQDLAGGRVWSGSQAKAAGLVDEIGGLDDCLAAVAKKAGIEKYEIVHRPNVSAGLDLSVLFGDPDASSRLAALGVSREALSLLGQAGLRTGVIDLFLRETLGGSSGRPTVWALAPDDLSIR